MKIVNLILLCSILLSCSKNGEIEDKVHSNEVKTLFYDNSFLKCISYYNSNLKIKQVVSFNENGSINQFGFLIDTFKVGVSSELYNNGFLQSRKEYKNSFKIGETYIYHSNGICKRYEYYDSKGKLSFFREYDSIGSKVKEKGDIMPRVTYNSDRSTICFLFALPPYCTNNVIIRNFINNKLIKQEEINNTQRFIWKVSNEKERFEVFVKLYDNYIKDSIVDKYRFNIKDLLESDL